MDQLSDKMIETVQRSRISLPRNRLLSPNILGHRSSRTEHSPLTTEGLDVIPMTSINILWHPMALLTWVHQLSQLLWARILFYSFLNVFVMSRLKNINIQPYATVFIDLNSDSILKKRFFWFEGGNKLRKKTLIQ